MVYPGKPSRGCYACRKRKVKCDQGIPQCARCIRIGKQCPGYRDENAVVFRSQNEIAKLNVTRRTQEVSSDDGLSQLSFASASPDEPQNTWTFFQHVEEPLIPGTPFPIPISPHSDPGTLIIAPALPLDWEYQALCYFFHRYVVPADGIGNPGWLDFLVDLYNESSDFSCLKWAVAAVSIAHLANQSDTPWLSTKARESYGDALQAVNFALRDPDQQTRDETLTAVYLLIFFESVKGDKREVLSAHAEGLDSLLRLRGDRQFATLRGRSLFRTVSGQLQARTLTLRNHPSAHLVRWISQANKALRVVAAANIMLRVCHVCATVTDVTSSSRNVQDCREEIVDLIQEAEDIDEEFEQWYKEDVPPVWRFWEVEEADNRWKRETSHIDGHTQPVHIYQNISLATTWNFVRTGRIILHQTLLECARFLSSMDPSRDDAEFWIQSPMCDKSMWIIDEMVSDLLASVSFLIGDIDSDGRGMPQFAGKVVGGIPLQWSLWVVKTCPFASTDRVLQSRKALERMGSVLGFRKAVSLAYN